MKIKKILSLALVFCMLCSVAVSGWNVVYAAEDFALCLYNDSDTSELVPADTNAYGYPTVTGASNGKNESYVTLAKDLTTSKGDVGRMELRYNNIEKEAADYASYRHLVMCVQV